jgi:DNA primase large subunit
VLSFYGVDTESDADSLTYQFERLADDRGAAFPPPACTTMEAFDLCVNRDEVCADIGHPVTYYAERVEREGVGDAADAADGD